MTLKPMNESERFAYPRANIRHSAYVAAACFGIIALVVGVCWWLGYWPDYQVPKHEGLTWFGFGVIVALGVWVLAGAVRDAVETGKGGED